MLKNIETDRLLIEAFTLDDTSFVSELYNTPKFIQFIGDRGIKTEEDAREYIQNSFLDSYKEHGYGLYKMSLKEDHTPIGACGFVKRDFLDHPDIGFAILPDYEGKGYTSEAAYAVMEYGRKELKMGTVLAIVSPENMGSQRLLEKNGLRKKGTMLLDGEEDEVLLYSTE